MNDSCEQARALFDDRGGQADEAGPSTAVEVVIFPTCLLFHDYLLIIFNLYVHEYFTNTYTLVDG